MILNYTPILIMRTIIMKKIIHGLQASQSEIEELLGQQFPIKKVILFLVLILPIIGILSFFIETLRIYYIIYFFSVCLLITAIFLVINFKNRYYGPLIAQVILIIILIKMLYGFIQ